MSKYKTLRECSDCHRTLPHHARGMCNGCYHRWRNGPAKRDEQGSPNVWTAGWVRDGLILRPAVNVREWSA